MTAKTETLVNFLVAELADNPERAKVLTKVREKWQISDRTFDRAWQVAKKQHSATQMLVQQAIVDKTIQTAVERTEQALLSREGVINELYADFNELKKMRAGTSIVVLNDKNEVIEILNPTPFDEVRAKQTRLSIAERIAAMEGWNPPVEVPAGVILNNNVQQNNSTVYQRSITFKTRTTTVKAQEIQDEPSE